MGNSSSHTHEPLERGFTRSKFGDVKNGKSSSFRFSKRSPKKMDRLRRSFRDSFRRRKDRVPESSKPHQWQADEEAVRLATCSFPVKYLGCVEVYDSRGMVVCEEALKVLRTSRRRPVRCLLHVSGDGLRVVGDQPDGGLIVDQTIEKVSFCAPDRNHERGFSYICRDGTTRRWMCHGFLACCDSGERLSHAVGCAFAVCLERKQRRDKECGVTMSFDVKNSTFTRTGSFRQQTFTDRLLNNERDVDKPSVVVPPVAPFPNPFAIERPHATPSMLERQGSFRAFSTIGSQSPFKRQMSLRINDLPSNAERQNAFMATTSSGTLALTMPNRSVSPIPEVSPSKARYEAAKGTATIDTVSQLCQELSHGLTLLSQTDATAATVDDLNFNNNRSINQNIAAAKNQQKSPPLVSNSYGYIGGSSSVGVVTPTAQVPPRVASISPTSPQLLGTPPTPTLSVGSTSSPEHEGEMETSVPDAEAWLRLVVNCKPAKRLKCMPVYHSTGRMRSIGSARPASGGADPFDAEWVAGVTKPVSPETSMPPTNAALPLTSAPLHSTNPFISPPKTPVQSFQVQL